MNSLKEKVVVITGGCSGIGLAIVKKLLNAEIKFIAIFELDTPNSRKVAENLKSQYNMKIGFYPCDVANTCQLEQNFEDVFQIHRTIDILINNAGINNEEDPALMIDINYKAVVLASFMMIKRVGKHNGGNGGVIINIASIMGLQNILFPIYCSTKHAVVSFTRTMKDHFETTGVRLIALCPGLTDTPIVKFDLKNLDFYSIDSSLFESFKKQSPDSVAIAVIKIIKEEKRGTVLVVEDDQEPYEVEDNSEFHVLSNFMRSNL